MDHETAVRLEATFSPEEVGEFEEHFFCCQERAEDVQAAAAFVANARAVFRDQARERRAPRMR
jgi:hypothetical protein